MFFTVQFFLHRKRLHFSSLRYEWGSRTSFSARLAKHHNISPIMTRSNMKFMTEIWEYVPIMFNGLKLVLSKSILFNFITKEFLVNLNVMDKRKIEKLTLHVIYRREMHNVCLDWHSIA